MRPAPREPPPPAPEDGPGAGTPGTPQALQPRSRGPGPWGLSPSCTLTGLGSTRLRRVLRSYPAAGGLRGPWCPPWRR